MPNGCRSACPGRPQFDVNDNAALASFIGKHNVVISLLPYTHHAAVTKAVCVHKVDVVTTSCMCDAILGLKDEIERAEIAAYDEIGLDPRDWPPLRREGDRRQPQGAESRVLPAVAVCPRPVFLFPLGE
ncbi:unnamed protein product [Tilletia controversa]|nr:unnamed protein product [Tilletia controversa]CAD6937376.1 unnamed protein product [Tilletia controversa]